MTTTLVFAFIIAIFVSSASSASLTPGNLLVSRLVTALLGELHQVFIDEITTSGTVVQTFIPENCLLHSTLLLGLSYNQDFTAAATTCFDWASPGTFPDLTQTSKVVAIRPDGTMDYTYIGITGTSLTGALVDGRNVWAGSGTVPLIHSRRNGQNTGGSVITTPAEGLSFVTDIQYQSGTFYIGGLTSSPYFIATVNDGPPTSAINPLNVSSLIDPDTFSPDIFKSDDPNRFYVYSSEEIYITSAVQGLYKLFSNDSGWYYYTVPSPIGPAFGVVVADVAGKRTAYVTKGGLVYAYEDDGSQFNDPIIVKSYQSDTIGDVTYIQAPAAFCDDSVKNQDESDVDCGGYLCNACEDGKACLINENCNSEYCNPNFVCSEPSCQDLFLNNDEADVDCGGEHCDPCAEGRKCRYDSDCATRFCNPENEKCAVPTCFDGFLNQDEMSADCGGASCMLCIDGTTCDNSTFCRSGYCSTELGTCGPPSCYDLAKNQNETDVDCGGVCGSTCAAGKTCLVDNDCASLICNNLVCEAPTCNDNVINQDETDVDCGGEVCSGCPDGKACVDNNDCESDNCVDNKCAANSNTPSTGSNTPISGNVSSGNRLSFVASFLVGPLVVASSLAKLL